MSVPGSGQMKEGPTQSPATVHLTISASKGLGAWPHGLPQAPRPHGPQIDECSAPTSCGKSTSGISKFPSSSLYHTKMCLLDTVLFFPSEKAHRQEATVTPMFRSTADSSRDPETECGTAPAVEHHSATKSNGVLTHATNGQTMKI